MLQLHDDDATTSLVNPCVYKACWGPCALWCQPGSMVIGLDQGDMSDLRVGIAIADWLIQRLLYESQHAFTLLCNIKCQRSHQTSRPFFTYDSPGCELEDVFSQCDYSYIAIINGTLLVMSSINNKK